MIVAEPFAFAVSFPSEETDTTDGSSDCHETVSVVSDGFSVAVRISVSPLFIVKEVLFNVTEVVATAAVISQTAVFPLVVVAVIVAVPFAFAVATPLDATETIDGAEDVHVMVSVELAGVSVALKETVSPI